MIIMAHARYTIRKIDGKLCVCKSGYSGMIDYVTFKQLRELDDNLYDKIYNNNYHHSNILNKFKHDCFIFFNKRMKEKKDVKD